MTQAILDMCDHCSQEFDLGSLARDVVDASLLFCTKCLESVARPCGYCQYDTKPPKVTSAIPGWKFGTNADQQWNPACKECAASRQLFRRIDTERMSAKQALRMLGDQLEKEGLGEEGLSDCDWDAERRQVLSDPFPDGAWVACYVVTGGNEGHYVHIDVLKRGSALREPERHMVAMVKTFLGRKRAYEVALRCAELLGA